VKEHLTLRLTSVVAFLKHTRSKFLSQPLAVQRRHHETKPSEAADHLEITVKRLCNAWVLDFSSHINALIACSMYLSDRRRSKGTFIKFIKESLRGGAQFLFDDSTRHTRRHWLAFTL
jgi:hypothetical protein